MSGTPTSLQEIIAAKARLRRERAGWSFEDKLTALDRLRAAAASFADLRREAALKPPGTIELE